MDRRTISAIVSLTLRPDRLFLLASLLFGSAFAILTPPFQVADEPAHFYRAYLVSEGRLEAIPNAERIFRELPASVYRIGTDLGGELPFHPEKKIAPATILASFRIPLEPEKRQPVFFPSSLQYTFLPYVPQAAGIAIGRLLNLPALALLYLARLANLLFGSLVIAFAIRRLPAYAWFATLVALTPMALALRGSASADVMTLAAAFVLVAAVAKLAWGPAGTARRSDILLLAAGAAVLCASKPPYLPLALLPWLIPAARFPRGRKVRVLLASTFLSLLAAAWAIATSRLAGTLRQGAGVDVDRQIHDAVLHPLRFLRIMAADYVLQAPRYLTELVGKLGWLDVQLPKLFLIAYLALLCALLFLDANPRIAVLPWQRGLAAAAVLAAMALISASQYAAWTRYGEDYIEGLQGRYFLPLVLAAAWLLHSRRWGARIPPFRLELALAAFSALSFGVALRALLGRYYGI